MISSTQYKSLIEKLKYIINNQYPPSWREKEDKYYTAPLYLTKTEAMFLMDILNKS